MGEIEIHKKLYGLIIANRHVVITSEYLEVNTSKEAISLCTDINIEFDQFAKTMRLKLKSVGVQVFKDIEQFRKVQKLGDNSNLLIANSDTPLSYVKKQTYSNFSLDDSISLFRNAKSYLDFITFLKSKEQEDEDGFQFVDNFKKDSRKISLISFSDYGRLDIQYGQDIPNLEMVIEHSHGLSRFKSCFRPQDKSLPKFLKSSLIRIGSRYDQTRRFQLIFENLEEIVKDAHINFQVYLNDLSIDKIKREYSDIKTKYFEELSEVLAKTSRQVVALPIGVSATLFAMYKLKDEMVYLVIIVIALFITSIYLFLILRAHLNDLVHIYKAFKTEFEHLVENEFFRLYPDERASFDDINTRVINRVKLLKNIVNSYFFILALTNSAIILLTLHSIGMANDGLIFTGLMFILAGIVSYLALPKGKVLE